VPPTSAAGARPDAFVSLLGLIAVSRDKPIFDFDLTSGPFVDRLTENMPVGPFTQTLTHH
jgi:hypothetical protein